jgi:curli biogenesis system outer membrane secretion channel CsgG
VLNILFGLVLLVQASPAPRVAIQAKPVSVDEEMSEKLLKAKRIFVESFGEDSTNKTLQSMIVDALRSSHRFIVTENKEKADLTLKGAALEKTSQELHAIGSATAVAGAAGGHSASIVGSGGSVSGSSSGGFAARSLGIEDSQASTETINDARVAVRLVSSDGDVVWSTTQESKGAKYKGASADVSDRIVKQLIRDIERLTQSQPGTK